MTSNKLLTAVLLAAIAAGTTNAIASVITYETRQIDVGVDSTDYAVSWTNQGSAISSSTLSDFNGTTPGNNAFAHLNIAFSVGMPLSAIFQIAPDAEYGGALYVDGVQVDKKTYDLWWGYDWNATSALLTNPNLALASGNHVLDGYWAEGCCSGGQGGRFSLDNGESWQSLTVGNLDAMVVPEPGMLALVSLGLAGVGFSRRKRGG